MLYLIKALALIFDGVLLQFASGIGLLALAVAALVGALRAPSWITPVLAIIFAGVAIYLPKLEISWLDKASSSSERPGFVLLVHFGICVVGYVLGRLARHFWGARKPRA